MASDLERVMEHVMLLGKVLVRVAWSRMLGVSPRFASREQLCQAHHRHLVRLRLPLAANKKSSRVGLARNQAATGMLKTE